MQIQDWLSHRLRPSLGLIGATRGGQAAASVAAFTVVLSMARVCDFQETDKDRSGPVASKILITAFVHHFVWRFVWAFIDR
jgi:hypothetical protein